MSPRISVIVPVYNVERELPRCLDSIVNQTFDDFETLLIDDGSTDSSLDIAKEYSGKDSRFRVFTQHNSGSACARNLGLENVKGEYIAFVDADDYIHPKYLETLFYLIRNYGCDVASCDYKPVGNDCQIDMQLDDIVDHNNEILDKTELFSRLFERLPFACVWGKLYKRKIIAEKKFLPFVMSEDLEFNSIVFNRVGNVIHTDLALYYYVMRDGSVTHSPFGDNDMSRLRAISRIYMNMHDYDGRIRSFMLKRTLKDYLSVRYRMTKQYKETFISTSHMICKEILPDFKRNPYIGAFYKWSILLFVKFPGLYDIFRRIAAFGTSIRTLGQ